MNEPWLLTMVGLDLTLQALATPNVEDRNRATGSECSESTLGPFAFCRATYQREQGFYSSIVSTQKVPLDVELTGSPRWA